jgi:predicted RNase H-like nuclease
MICRDAHISCRTYGFSKNRFRAEESCALKFVGIDLAWGENNPSGVAVIEADGTITRGSSQLRSNDEICRFADLDCPHGAVVAIDAPLRVQNAGKCRPVEEQLTQTFWPYDAAPYPANLSNPAFQESARISQLVCWLEGKGFVQRAGVLLQQEQKTIVEVFPSPALVMLFPGQNRREHIHCRALRYKHKQDRSWAEVHSEWEIYRARLRSLERGEPALKFTSEVNKQIGIDITEYKGSRYKQFDDLLDGIFCAYLAYYFWYWGTEGSWIVGDLETGCVTLPRCRLANCPIS